MGVGSSLLAAIMHNRKAMGCEKEEIYVQIALQRIKNYYNGNLHYRPLGKPIYQPLEREEVRQVSDE
jgi:adenine-specific DNA-methyltransferase